MCTVNNFLCKQKSSFIILGPLIPVSEEFISSSKQSTKRKPKGNNISKDEIKYLLP